MSRAASSACGRLGICIVCVRLHPTGKLWVHGYIELWADEGKTVMPAAPVLVTGGLGFLGLNLSNRLLAAGEKVRIMARPRNGATAPPTPDCEILWGDIRDPEAVDRAVRGAEVVVHLASNFRRAGSDETEA